MNLQILYKKLLSKYGSQGWWPLIEFNGVQPTKTGSLNGYHPKDYSFPKTEKQKYEICVGAILTQNTSWTNVEMALQNLKNIKALSPKAFLDKDINKVKEAIKPAGYFNQKYNYIRIFTEFFISFDNEVPSRDEILKVRGVGNETADAILLYAYKVPTFVIDAYTKRILIKLNLASENSKYLEMQNLFESNLDKDYKLYQEYHALLVEHAKRFYQRKPFGKDDDLL